MFVLTCFLSILKSVNSMCKNFFDSFFHICGLCCWMSLSCMKLDKFCKKQKQKWGEGWCSQINSEVEYGISVNIITVNLTPFARHFSYLFTSCYLTTASYVLNYFWFFSIEMCCVWSCLLQMWYFWVQYWMYTNLNIKSGAFAHIFLTACRIRSALYQ